MSATYSGLNPFLQSVSSLLNQNNFIPPSTDPELFGYVENNLYEAPDPIEQDSKFDSSGLAISWTGVTGGTAFYGNVLNRDGAIVVRRSTGGTSLFIGNFDETNPLEGTSGYSIAASGFISASRFVDHSNTAYYVDPAASGTSVFAAGQGIFGGKVTASSFDPIYELGDKQYATYAPSMIGIKEEVTFNTFVEGTYLINFADLELGSDLWIFSKITDLGENLENLVVLLTPSQHGVMPFYQKIGKSLTIAVNPYWASSEVSVRLTAPRFDDKDNKTLLDIKYEHPLKPKEYVDSKKSTL